MGPRYVVAVIPDGGGPIEYLGPVEGSMRCLVRPIDRAGRFETDTSAETWARNLRRSWVGVHHAIEVHELRQPWLTRALTRALAWLGV